MIMQSNLFCQPMKIDFLTLLASGLLSISTNASLPPCGLPSRMTAGAWSSSKFYQQLNSPSPLRELAVVHEVLAGNIPDQLRAYAPLIIKVQLQGAPVILELEVVPDYLMIGTDADFVRTPLTNYSAQYLASEMGLVMPTPYLVDQIYNQATVKMIPQPTDWYRHEADMRTGSNYLVFNNTLEAQRNTRSGLIAGHKKDVVLTNRLDSAPGKVAIYGWQQPGNHPIQPLATPHDYTYEDYSHGIRFLGPTLKITFVRTGLFIFKRLVEALVDPELGSILNGGQGAIHDVRAARTCSAEFIKAMGLTAATCPPQPRLCALQWKSGFSRSSRYNTTIPAP